MILPLQLSNVLLLKHEGKYSLHPIQFVLINMGKLITIPDPYNSHTEEIRIHRTNHNTVHMKKYLNPASLPLPPPPNPASGSGGQRYSYRRQRSANGQACCYAHQVQQADVAARRQPAAAAPGQDRSAGGRGLSQG